MKEQKHRDLEKFIKKPREASEWVQVLAFFLLTIGIVLGPLYMVSQFNEDTKAIMARLERSAEQATNRSIRVNVFTLACLREFESTIESESTKEEQQRFEIQLSRCIREGLTIAEELDLALEPNTPTAYRLSEATSVVEEPFGSFSVGYILVTPGSDR